MALGCCRFVTLAGGDEAQGQKDIAPGGMLSQRSHRGLAERFYCRLTRLLRTPATGGLHAAHMMPKGMAATGLGPARCRHV